MGITTDEDDDLSPQVITAKDSKATFLKQLKSEKEASLVQSKKLKEKRRSKDRNLKAQAMERKALVTNLLQELVITKETDQDQESTNGRKNHMQIPRTLPPVRELEIKPTNVPSKGLINIKSIDLQVKNQNQKSSNFNRNILFKNNRIKRIPGFHAALISKIKRVRMIHETHDSIN